MGNAWLVAKHEYERIALRRSFLLATLLIPAVIVGLTAILVLIMESGQSRLPIGYVDPGGLLDPSLHARLPDAQERVQIREYADLAAAQLALERGEVQAVFAFPATYPGSLNVDLYVQEETPGDRAWGDMDDFVRVNLLAAYPQQVQERLLKGSTITVHDVASGREFGKSAVVNIILPFVGAFLFFFATMMASAYLLEVVADEKENRTMEVLLTSVTPGQLIGGKLLGLLAAALTQLAIYVLTVVVAVLVAAPYVPELQQATIPWTYLAVMALFFLPAYALLAAVMVALGSAVTEVQQGQQISGLLNLIFMLPIFMLIIIFEDPAHPFVVAMTLFPTSAFLTIALRWGLGTVPLWQIALSWTILVASSAFMMWAAARVFRVGMLKYGQPLSFKAVLAAVRGE